MILLTCLVVVVALGLYLNRALLTVEAAPPRLNAEKPTSDQLDIATAKPELEARLQQNPNDADALVELAACNLDLGEDTAAIDQLNRAMNLTTESRRLVNIGLYLARAARSAEALAAFEKSLVANPRDPQTLYRAGLLAYHSLGDKERAARHWTQYLEVAPSAVNAEQIRQTLAEMGRG